MMRVPIWIICLVATIAVGISTENLYAQRGGGGRRGGGDGVPGGMGDLRPSRRGQFDDYPWEAQKLLEANRQTIRRLPMPLRAYILENLKEWDSFFPVRQQQFEIFFQKAQVAQRSDLLAAFRDAIPEQFRTRNTEQSPQGRRQRPTFSPEDLTPDIMAKIDLAFQAFVLPDQDLPPGLIILALTESTKELSPDIVAQGTLLKNITFTGNPHDWMASVQTGTQESLKGKSLATPSLFEYHNREIKDATRTLAFYQTKDAPPAASKTKGYGKKCAPLIVVAPELSEISATIDAELGDAIRKGKSEKYIELMVKPKLTPEALKLNKTIPNKPLAGLVSHVLMDSETSRTLDGHFIENLTHRALNQALPDLLFAQWTPTAATPSFLTDLITMVQNHPRYRSDAIICILDSAARHALLLGRGIPTGKSIEQTQSLDNLGATLAQLANINADHATGRAIDDLKK